MKILVTWEGKSSVSVPGREYDVWELTCVCIDYRDAGDRERRRISQNSELLLRIIT